MVEIYANTELNDVLFEVEALQEWKELAQEMGMESQLESIKGKESPNPYPYMNKGIQIIMETLCPTKVKFKEYNKTPIPLEVMKQLAFSVRDNHFKHIEIWYDDITPDPVAIGYTYQYYAYDREYKHLLDENKKDVLFETETEAKDYCSTIGFQYQGINKKNENKYLIARWADILRPFNELKELAKERLIEKYGATLKNEIEEKTQALKKLTDNTILFLNGEITESQLKGQRW